MTATDHGNFSTAEPAVETRNSEEAPSSIQTKLSGELRVHDPTKNSETTITAGGDEESLSDKPALDEIIYHEGGLKAWSVVLGSFFGMMVTFGFTGAIGTVQSWLLKNQLSEHSEAEVAWIFSVWLFFMFSGSVVIGPLFDAYGIRVLVIPGGLIYVLSIMLLSLCKEYYQFILGFSVLGGISCSMVFNPCVTVVGHYFYRRRAFATGICFSGGAIGGIMFPLSLNKLLDRVGYGWGIRIMGFAVLAALLICCALVESRTFPSVFQTPQKKVLIDTQSFKDRQFLLVCLGVFFLELAFFTPLSFLVLYAEDNGMTPTFANSLISILNACSVVGRAIPGYLGDKVGPFNMAAAMNFMAGLVTLTVWLTVGHKTGGIIAYAALFGFFSGSCLSLIPTCIGRISDTRRYGARFGTCYFLASVAALIGLPVGGALKGNNYVGTIAFTGAIFIAASLCYFLARMMNGHHQTLFY